MQKTEKILPLIKKFIDYIEKLSEDDIAKINSNEATIRYEYINHNILRTSKPKLLKHVITGPVDVDKIIKDLSEFSSRQDGEIFLYKKCPNRIQMEKVAKKLDIPFQKKTNNEQLRDKIIEATIGFRLRSKAIQANNNEH